MHRLGSQNPSWVSLKDKNDYIAFRVANIELQVRLTWTILVFSRIPRGLDQRQINIVFGQTILVIPFHLLEWSKWFENSLEWFEKKWCWMVWLCEFWGGINDWDLKILYRDLESWKKKVEKKWNGIEWFVGLEIPCLGKSSYPFHSILNYSKPFNFLILQTIPFHSIFFQPFFSTFQIPIQYL